jgi:hypothetical protein
MKRNNDYYYAGISSFEDIRLEKSRLILKGRLMESKLNIDLVQLRERFSISALASSVLREYILPRISDLLGFLVRKVDSETE